MLTIIAILMIIVFIILLAKEKLSVFTALTIVPFVFGIIIVILTDSTFVDLFDWIYQGLFYSVNEQTGEISMGVISPGLIILFAVLYFDIMLNAGLFDPLVEFFIKKAKGDPLKVTMSTVLTALVVTMNGDTTTTIIILVAAFLSLYKQLNMKLSYLAILTVGPIGIWNQLPWGGPTIAASTAIGVPLNELFAALLPGMLAASVFVVILAYYLGKKERKRLEWSPEKSQDIDEATMQGMLDSVRQNKPEYKRLNLVWFNLILTLTILIMLIAGVAHGAVLFMVGSAIALTVNYRDTRIVKTLINEVADDVLAPALATFAAGAFSGILTYSGMATSLATSITQIIPESLGEHIAPIYAILATPAIVFLPQDAFYFGISNVMAEVMGQYGITSLQAAVASMVGQSFRLISPVIPALYMLTDQTEQNFVDFQKIYAKYCWPILFIYLFVYILTGMIPI